MASSFSLCRTMRAMAVLVVTSGVLESSEAFVSSPANIVRGSQPTLLHDNTHHPVARTQLFSATQEDSEIKSMRAGEIKKELESYGISTASMFEKKELVEALEKARADGLKPKPKAEPAPKKKKSRPEVEDVEFEAVTSTSSTSASSSSEKKEDDKPKDTRPREERLKEELEKCQAMKAGELKKELQERGISTASFFEKSDFVKALADARVDGVDKRGEEGYAEYTEVEVLTDDSSGPRQSAGSKKAEAPKSSGSPFGASPFGGGGAPGGMGGMGGIADILNSMGMGGAAAGGAGAAGGSPFGGAGANPFAGMGGMGGMGGDAMGKAQEMMKNPKVMELVMKAQSNPKIAAALQECMSNPAAFAKYQNDPEVKELLDELKKVM